MISHAKTFIKKTYYVKISNFMLKKRRSMKDLYICVHYKSLCTYSMESGFEKRGTEERKTSKGIAVIFLAGGDVGLKQSWDRMNEKKGEMLEVNLIEVGDSLNVKLRERDQGKTQISNLSKWAEKAKYDINMKKYDNQGRMP